MALLLSFTPLGAQALPSFREVKENYASSEGRLLDRHGRLLQEIRLDHGGRTLPWVGFDEVSPALKEAVLFVEDRRFFSHGGVDFLALAGAALGNVIGEQRRGASTLTMQVVNFLEPGLRKRKGFWDKLRQVSLALELEKKWHKEEIFEAYLNLVSFRGENRGARAASRALFQKDPEGLRADEAYLLAILLKSPGMGAEAAATRLCAFAKMNPKLGPCEKLRTLSLAALGHPAIERRVSLAPHLAEELLGPGSRELTSTIDLELQSLARDLLHEQAEQLKDQNVRDGAVLVIDNKTGEVLAYVGGTGAISQAPAVDMALAPRQAGSTLKPFLYALGFEKGYLTSQSWLLDEPWQSTVEGRGEYHPENYDKSFHGPVTVAQALGSSLNIPAVRAAELIGVEPFHDFLSALGFRGLRPAEDYGFSLALGAAEVTLFDLANAYRTLANGGLHSPLHFVKGPAPAAKRVLSRKVAEEISGILASRENRALTFGWDSLLSTPYGTAVKTGTSKDMRDNWCVGYSDAYTVAVWMGNSGGEPMWQVSGISGAAPIWRGIMDQLHRGRRSRAFAMSEKPQAFERPSFGRILYPAASAILALDPDIPPANQRLQVETEGEGEIFLGDQLLPEGVWAPVRGKYRLSLRHDGKVLDQLSFEVR